MIGVQNGAALAGHADFAAVFRDWLDGNEALGSATSDLQSFFSVEAARDGVGRIWENAAWREPWLAALLADQPDDAVRAQTRDTVGRLAAGEADVVITGQQPGFLGGPLYTLYKVSACVVLAEMRTAAGRPTVPVFWSGDDDDDLREALQPVAWDPGRGLLVRHADHGARGLSSDRMVGSLPAGEIARGAAGWLAEMAGRGPLAGDLADLWAGAVADDLPWSVLQRRALLRIFAGYPLLVVHGNDPALHAAAEPFYRALWTGRAKLREAARVGGQRLEAAGYDSAIGEPSIQRFLHLGSDGRRRPVAADHRGTLPAADQLRPGVVVRSPVQDWLFRPAGVVVGPGEVAYLKQLEPAYEAFGLPRAPLLPRLFAQFGPAGHGEFRAWAMGVADRDRRDDADRFAAVATRTVAAARPDLVATLREHAGLDGEALAEVSDLVQRRWARQLEAVLKRQDQRRRDDAGAGQPPWMRPGNRRQERALAAVAAVALWGEDVMRALAHASRRHVDAGLDGDWREFLLTVPVP